MKEQADMLWTACKEGHMAENRISRYWEHQFSKYKMLISSNNHMNLKEFKPQMRLQSQTTLNCSLSPWTENA